MATGGDRNAVCSTTATMQPNHTMSYHRPLATGASRGRRLRTIAGHTNGQYSRNNRVSWHVMVPQADNGAASSVLVIQPSVPSQANTAPKTLEATARNSTMLVVASVRLQALKNPFQVNLP